MITAKEARDLSNRIGSHLKDLHSEVSKNALMGVNKIECFVDAHGEELKLLKEHLWGLGYATQDKKNDRIPDTILIISWEKEF